MAFIPEQKPLFEIPPQGEVIRVKGNTAFEMVYRHKNGELYQGNSIEWLNKPTPNVKTMKWGI